MHIRNALKLKSTIGGALLISGSCIGIGMLALPVVTGLSGFFLSTLLLIGASLYMLSTAYLLVELDLGDHPKANIITLAEHTLGSWAKISTWITYLFLFYCLMIAYIAKGGDIFLLIIQHVGLADYFPEYFGGLALTAVSFLLIFSGNQVVDLFNRIFVIGLFASFLILIIIGLKEFEPSNLQYHDVDYLLPAIPFAITAFGFHNMIPTISDYLDRDRRKLISAIVLGALIAFCVYLVWNITVQAAVTVGGSNGLKEAFHKGLIGTEILYFNSHNSLIKLSAIYLSFFAIITSLLGQGLALVDFILDGSKLKGNNQNRITILLSIFIPCYIAAHTIPSVFFIALGLAGGIAAVYLFCLLPILMTWSKYRSCSCDSTLSLSGKFTLAGLLTLSILIIGYEIYHQISNHTNLLT